MTEARSELGRHFALYKHGRPHPALAYRTPAEVFGAVAVPALASSRLGC